MTETGEQDIDGNKEGQSDDYDGVLPFRLLPWRSVSSSEITTIEISWDRNDGEYFFGEDATIMASYGNHSAVLNIYWMRKIDSVDHVEHIDTKLQKYTGSTCSNMVEKPKLLIKNCDESDIGTYHLLVMCKNHLPIYSKKIDLKVVKGPPRVAINPVPLALQNELVEIKATIRCFPKCQSVIWMKNDQLINTTDPKYDVNNCEFPVLCIKKVTESDNGVYKVIARNELGEGESSEDLEVIGESEMLFISGPVVVSPLKRITFQAYLPGREKMNAKWWKIKDHTKEELKVDNQKYHINYQSNDIVCFEIFWADQEDSAAYQLSLGKRRSNRINVCVDDSGTFSTSKQGNRLRLFELQSVSADAMRIVFDKMPDSFANKIKEYCNLFPNSKRTNDLLSDLQKGTKSSSKNLDISLMYSIIRNLWKEAIPKNGWGKIPKEEHLDRADDIERIRHYRNFICHSDDSGIDTNVFNFSCLDLSRAIGRLSSNDPTLIKTSCEIMNRVSTKGEYLHEMIEKIEKEKKLDETLLNEDPPSPPSFPQDDARDDGPMNRASPSSSNKDISNQSSSVNENMDDEPRPRASPSSSNKDFPSPPSSPQGDARDDGPMHRASPSSSNKDPPSPPSSPQDDARDDGPMHRASPSSCNKDLFSSPSLFLHEDRDEAPRHRTPPSMTNQDLFSSPSLFLHEDRDEAPRHRTPPSMTNQDLFSSPSLFLHEDRDEAPRHRTSPSMTNQEIYVRAQRTEGPMTYADRKFSDNSESENHYRSQRTERPMRYSNRRLSNNTDSESLYYTRIPTRSGKIKHIRFHEVCDPEIIMDETYTTAKQTKPYGDGMFFMNRPLKLEEKIHIYGCTYSNASFRESRPTMKIGLISIDPGEIREAVQQKKYYVRGLEEIKCFSDDDQKTDFFHMYICLCPNATLSICVKGLQEHFYENQEISSFNAIWLVIEPYGIDKIKILPN